MKKLLLVLFLICLAAVVFADDFEEIEGVYICWNFDEVLIFDFDESGDITFSMIEEGSNDRLDVNGASGYYEIEDNFINCEFYEISVSPEEGDHFEFETLESDEYEMLTFGEIVEITDEAIYLLGTEDSYFGEEDVVLERLY